MNHSEFKALCSQIKLLDDFEAGFRSICEQEIIGLSVDLKRTAEREDNCVIIKRTDDQMKDAETRKLAREIDTYFGHIKGEAGIVLNEIKRLKQNLLDRYGLVEANEEAKKKIIELHAKLDLADQNVKLWTELQKKIAIAVRDLQLLWELCVDPDDRDIRIELNKIKVQLETKAI